MGHNPSRWKIRQEEKRLAAERQARAAVDRDRAVAAVSAWNADILTGRAPALYPTIGAAIAAGTPWLTYMCPGCRQFGDTDLRTFDHHPAAPISSLIPKLSCNNCCPNPPLALLRELRDGHERPIEQIHGRENRRA